jgi:phosphoglycolate phosphatase
VRPTVLLWDIDGTLITSGGAGRKAIERAFEIRYGRRDAMAFDFSGMTDRAIVRRGLIFIGREATEREIDDALAEYVHVLEDEVAKATVYRLHAGIAQALDATRDRKGFATGLGTGNIRAGARVKLDRVKIYERFAFGGFGCDHEDRTELIRTGAMRGAEALGVPLAECRVLVIGDTPKDVAAAQGIGAESIGVGTGHFTAPQLLACGATHAFADLSAAGALDALLG